MVTELVKDLFIPDAPTAEPIPYRCISRTRVVHINKVFRPGNRMIASRFCGGESDGTGKTGFEMREFILADGVRCVDTPDPFRAAARDAGGG
jgi:hypothetical protein